MKDIRVHSKKVVHILKQSHTLCYAISKYISQVGKSRNVTSDIYMINEGTTKLKIQEILYKIKKKFNTKDAKINLNFFKIGGEKNGR